MLCVSTYQATLKGLHYEKLGIIGIASSPPQGTPRNDNKKHFCHAGNNIQKVLIEQELSSFVKQCYRYYY